jgi:type VI protein secretion system component Hcp
MPTYLSFETEVKSQGRSTGHKSAKFGNGRVRAMQQGFRELSPSTALRDIRRDAPLVITAEFELHSFQYFSSHNGPFNEIHLKFANAKSDGKTQPYLAITLTNALVNVRPGFHPSSNHGESQDTYEVTEYKFTFQKIEIENLSSSKSAKDGWTG